MYLDSKTQIITAIIRRVSGGHEGERKGGLDMFQRDK